MTINDTSHNSFVVHASGGTGTSLNLNQTQAFIHLLKDNKKKINLPMYKSTFTEITFRYHLVSIDTESKTQLVYKPLYTQEEMVLYTKCVLCDCKMFMTTAWICSHVIGVYIQKKWILDTKGKEECVMFGTVSGIQSTYGLPKFVLRYHGKDTELINTTKLLEVLVLVLA